MNHHHADTQTEASAAAMTPEKAREILEQGNVRFVDRLRSSRDLNQQVAQTSTGQHPYAAIVGCIDSRVPAELVFDAGIGDLFNARIAGNFLNTDIMGSLEFASSYVKLIVVLGHKACGAVKGACDNEAAIHETGNEGQSTLLDMLKNLGPALKAVPGETADRSSNNKKHVQNVTDANVQLTVQAIKDTASDELKKKIAAGEIGVVGAMYDINTGVVKFS